MERSGNIIGRQLAKLRNEKGISQATLAEICQRLGWDVSRDVLARVENQVRAVTEKELVILAAALEVPVSDILTPQVGEVFLASSKDVYDGYEEEKESLD